MPLLLDCLSDCQPKVRSDLMSFLKLNSDELVQEIALLRELGLNIQEENNCVSACARNAVIKSTSNFDRTFPLFCALSSNYFFNK